MSRQRADVEYLQYDLRSVEDSREDVVRCCWNVKKARRSHRSRPATWKNSPSHRLLCGVSVASPIVKIGTVRIIDRPNGSHINPNDRICCFQAPSSQRIRSTSKERELIMHNKCPSGLSAFHYTPDPDIAMRVECDLKFLSDSRHAEIEL